MNCNDIRTLRQLQLDGERLSPADAEKVSRRRAQCSVCAHELEQQAKLTAALRALPVVDAPAAAMTALRSTLQQARPVAPLSCAECQQILADHGDRQLPAHLSEQVAVHLATCTQCAQAAADDQTTTALFAALPEATPPAELRAALKRRLSGPEARPVAPLTCDEAERLLSQRLDEDLPADAETRLEVHLANCTRCTRLAAALEQQQALLRSLAEAPAPADLPKQIAARLAAQRLSVLAALFHTIRRSRQAMLSVGLGAVATICVALGVMNANQRSPLAATPALRQTPLPRQRPVTRPSTPARPTPAVAERRSPAPVVRLAENAPSRARRSPRAVRVVRARLAPAPSAGKREPSSTATPPPAEAAPSPTPAVTDANATSNTSTPAADLATPPSVSEPVVVTTQPDAGALAAATEPTTAAPASSATSAAASSSAPPVAAEASAAPAATTPAPSAYVDDSPDHAPSPGVVLPPEHRSVANPSGPPTFEAPPVETTTVVASTTTSPAKKTDQLAELRRKLHRRRPVEEASERIAGKPDKMATVDLLKVEF